MASALEIRNLHVSVENKPILNGVDLIVKQGEVHALMGPNGVVKFSAGPASSLVVIVSNKASARASVNGEIHA